MDGERHVLAVVGEQRRSVGTEITILPAQVTGRTYKQELRRATRETKGQRKVWNCVLFHLYYSQHQQTQQEHSISLQSTTSSTAIVAQMDSGILPVKNLLASKYSPCSSVRLASSVGIAPEKRLLFNRRVVRLVSNPISVGNGHFLPNVGTSTISSRPAQSRLEQCQSHHNCSRTNLLVARANQTLSVWYPQSHFDQGRGLLMNCPKARIPKSPNSVGISPVKFVL